jgi:hypothetical protein
MSDSKFKAERSAAKNARQGVVEQRPTHGSKSHKGKKPYELRGTFWWFKDFSIGKYATLEDAEKSLATHLKRKSYNDLRIVGPGTNE